MLTSVKSPQSSTPSQRYSRGTQCPLLHAISWLPLHSPGGAAQHDVMMTLHNDARLNWPGMGEVWGVCMRERGRRTLITLWNRIEYVTRFHARSLNFKYGNWRYLHVSNLQVLLVILIFTAVARKRPWSFCQKCRWQVTAEHAYTLHMWLCMK